MVRFRCIAFIARNTFLFIFKSLVDLCALRAITMSAFFLHLLIHIGEEKKIECMLTLNYIMIHFRDIENEYESVRLNGSEEEISTCTLTAITNPMPMCVCVRVAVHDANVYSFLILWFISFQSPAQRCLNLNCANAHTHTRRHFNFSFPLIHDFMICRHQWVHSIDTEQSNSSRYVWKIIRNML